VPYLDSVHAQVQPARFGNLPPWFSRTIDGAFSGEADVSQIVSMPAMQPDASWRPARVGQDSPQFERAEENGLLVELQVHVAPHGERRGEIDASRKVDSADTFGSACIDG
jgi:hypothetical protein